MLKSSTHLLKLLRKLWHKIQISVKSFVNNKIVATFDAMNEDLTITGENFRELDDSSVYAKSVYISGAVPLAPALARVL